MLEQMCRKENIYDFEVTLRLLCAWGNKFKII